MEESLKETHNWEISEDRARIKEIDGVGNFNDLVTKRLKHSFDLEPFYGFWDFITPILAKGEIGEEGSVESEEASYCDSSKEGDEKLDQCLNFSEGSWTHVVEIEFDQNENDEFPESTIVTQKEEVACHAD